MEQKSIVQEGSLEGVIKTVKGLIANVEMKIKKGCENNSAPCV